MTDTFATGTRPADYAQALAEVAQLHRELAHERAQVTYHARTIDDLRLDLGDLRAEVQRLTQERDEARAELKDLQGNRLISAIFSHHPGAPKPFGLYRNRDTTGVSGTGLVALGAEFPDGMVVLRWLSDWPTSVVFHERGIESVEAIHGHGGNTSVVWLSDELDTLADLELERDNALAEVEQLRELNEAAERARQYALPFVNAAPALALEVERLRTQLSATESIDEQYQTEIAAVRDSLTEARAKLTSLRHVAREMSRAFYHSGHPGYPAKQSGWVDVITIQRWNDVIDASQDTE